MAFLRFFVTLSRPGPDPVYIEPSERIEYTDNAPKAAPKRKPAPLDRPSRHFHHVRGGGFKRYRTRTERTDK